MWCFWGAAALQPVVQALSQDRSQTLAALVDAVWPLLLHTTNMAAGTLTQDQVSRAQDLAHALHQQPTVCMCVLCARVWCQRWPVVEGSCPMCLSAAWQHACGRVLLPCDMAMLQMLTAASDAVAAISRLVASEESMKKLRPGAQEKAGSADLDSKDEAAVKSSSSSSTRARRSASPPIDAKYIKNAAIQARDELTEAVEEWYKRVDITAITADLEPVSTRSRMLNQRLCCKCLPDQCRCVMTASAVHQSGLQLQCSRG